MKYKVGDRVKIKSLDWYNENKTVHGDIWFDNAVFVGGQSLYCGCELTIYLVTNDHYYVIENDYYWTDEMIEGLVEDEKKPEFKVGDEVIAYAEGCIAKFSIKDVRWNSELNKFEYKICSSWHDASVMQLYKKADNFLIERNDDNGLPFNEWLSHKGAFYVPNGYEIKDENGNIINAQKIVLEKKKKEYPKTYEECCEVLGHVTIDEVRGYKATLLDSLQMLLVCRDAYWKIAGEEMGFGKPWEPSKDKMVYSIYRHSNEIETDFFSGESVTFEFPTAEIRDAFKENFDPDIEICKELL